MIHGERPPKAYRTGFATRWLRRGGLIATAAITVFLIVRYPSLPETIPTHFGVTGEADAWGPRWTIFILVALLGGVVFGMTWLSGRPQAFNYPLVITDTNAQSVYREGERMMVWVTVSIVLLYAGTAAASLAWRGGPLIIAGLLWMVASLAVGVTRIMIAHRTPRVDL